MEHIFQCFMIDGFECSSHCLRSGHRLDLLASTQPHHLIRADFERLQAYGIRTVRSGIRWHQIEERPHVYNFANELPQVRRANEMQMQIIWDLCHYGWPDDLDIFAPEFVDRFVGLVVAFVRLLDAETGQPPLLALINEISFLAWAGGQVGYLNPFAVDRGIELKMQLVRATIAAMEAVWAIQPKARIFHIDLIIHITSASDDPEARQIAEGAHLAQWQAWDMIARRTAPELGGREKYLDIVSINYYPYNQWVHQQNHIFREHPKYRPFRQIINDVFLRYRRPLFIAETGVEDDARPEWLRYICDEMRAAQATGIPVQTICWYPIFNYPGWDDDRHCHAGLWGYVDSNGHRKIYGLLACEFQIQRQLFERQVLPDLL